MSTIVNGKLSLERRYLGGLSLKIQFYLEPLAILAHDKGRLLKEVEVNS